MVRRCLMETLDANLEDVHDCDALKEAGNDSHPACYEQTGFCDLPRADWVKIFNTVEHQHQDFRQFLSVGLACLGETFS